MTPQLLAYIGGMCRRLPNMTSFCMTWEEKQWFNRFWLIRKTWFA